MRLGHAVALQRLARQNAIQQVFERFPDGRRTAAQHGGDLCLYAGQVGMLSGVHPEARGEEQVIGLTVRHMEIRADGVGQRMHRAAARAAEGESCHIAGHEKIRQALQNGVAVEAGVHDFLIARQQLFNGGSGECVGVRRRVYGNIGLDGVDQRVDRAGGKHAVGQRAEHGRNQHRLVGIQLRAHESQLGMQRANFGDGNVGDLAARAAGGGNHNQLPQLRQRFALGEQLFTAVTAAENQQLRNVDDRTAANGDHAADLATANGGQNAVDHAVVRLASAEFLLTDDCAGRGLAIQLRLQHIAVGEYQVALTDLVFCKKCFQAIHDANGSVHLELHGFHLPLSARQLVVPISSNVA